MQKYCLENLESVQELIKNHDVNITSKFGKTALHFAAEIGNFNDFLVNDIYILKQSLITVKKTVLQSFSLPVEAHRQIKEY